MRKEDKDHKLTDALAELDAADIAPDWKQDAAWARIESNLEQRQKRVFSLWPYAAAAAITLLIGLTFFLNHPSTEEAGSTAVTIPNTRPAPIALPDTLDAQPAVQKRVAVAAPRLQKAHYQNVTVDSIRSITLSRPDTLPASQVLPPPKVAAIRHPPAIIYTLSEIMDGEPERVAPPPKKYSGLFHSRSSSADAPDGQFLQRRRLRREDGPDGLSPSPDIIN